MCQNHEQNKGLKVLRTYGIELEGYTSENIRGNYVRGWNLVADGSLNEGSCECESCEGSGNRYYDCESCYGSGHTDCYKCDGYGDIECSDCCGGGEVPCDNCDCTGYVEGEDGEEVYCPVCDGSQYVECSTCEGNGRNECERCEGEGRIECGDCDGNGNYEDECNECYGSGEYGDGGDCGVECVSGVLTEGDYDDIDRIFDYIYNNNWYVNDDCGTHIHIGANDLEASDLAKLAILQNIVEPMIFGTLDEYRMNTNYCKKTKRAMVDAYIDTYLQKGDNITLQDIADFYYGYSKDLGGNFSKYDHARYYGLNLHSYFYRRNKCDGATVEFRYFEGCDDRELAKAWIDLCIKLVDFAKHSTFEQLMVIGREFYLVDNLQEYIEKIKELLGLEYNFEPKSDWSFAESKRNVASHLRTTHIITRAV